MKHPYTYSMPPNFMTDQAVPARWRVLGIINGFAIAGKVFYGSNRWLSEQLGCCENTITNAVSELERLGEIEVSRTKNSRTIKRTLRKDPNQLGPNTDSNADKHNGEQSSQSEYRIVPDVEEKPPKPPKSTCYQVFEVFREVTGKYPLNWKTNKAQRQSAENLYQERGLEQIKKALEFHRETKGEPFCPAIQAPYDLDSKWSKLSEFRKKHNGD